MDFEAPFNNRVFKRSANEVLTHVLFSANEDKSNPIALKWFTSEELAKSYLSATRQKIEELKNRKIAVKDRVHHIIQVRLA